MLKVARSNRFIKDLKLAVKRGFDISLLDIVIDKLIKGEKLDKKYKDHQLIGNYKDFRECHIEPALAFGL